MNQSMPWSLLAGTALALLLMTPITSRTGGRPTATFLTLAVATVQNGLDALTESASANRNDAPEAATLSLLVAGTAGFWCLRRRNSQPSR